MIYGYLRVSSDEQDVNSQRQGVVQFAKDKGWEIEKYISDEGVSGGKDPDKRKLGPLLSKITKGDTIICSEISRLGRDLYMVMDILHHCMKVGAVIYTVKDRFVLGDDVQSKVLAFAFGLSAEIERQMIRQRTREGLRLRMKLGILLGRLLGRTTAEERTKYAAWRDRLAQMVEWQMTPKQIADVIGCDRNTVNRLVASYGLGKDWKFKVPTTDRNKERHARTKHPSYKDGGYKIVQLDREKVRKLILADKSIPKIASEMPEFTYEQIYDTILCDAEFNPLYRQHAQKKLVKSKVRNDGK